MSADPTRVTNLRFESEEELLAHAHALEVDAADRFAELADTMEVHNNPEVAEFFRKMERIERIHVDNVDEMAHGKELPHIAPWDYKWEDGTSPEAMEVMDTHYLMRPYHAIEMAARHEQRAADFFAAVAEQAATEEVKQLALKLCDEEKEHVQLLKDWLEKVEQPEADWYVDMDPPDRKSVV